MIRITTAKVFIMHVKRDNHYCCLVQNVERITKSVRNWYKHGFGEGVTTSNDRIFKKWQVRTNIETSRLKKFQETCESGN